MDGATSAAKAQATASKTAPHYLDEKHDRRQDNHDDNDDDEYGLDDNNNNDDQNTQGNGTVTSNPCNNRGDKQRTIVTRFTFTGALSWKERPFTGGQGRGY